MDGNGEEPVKGFVQSMYNRLSEELFITGAAVYLALADDVAEAMRQRQGDAEAPPPEIADGRLAGRLRSFGMLRNWVADYCHEHFDRPGPGARPQS